MKFYHIILYILVGLIACSPKTKKVVDPIASNDQESMNILWLVTEDMGPFIPPFGDSTIVTPNLSRLAAEGVVYPNLYSPSGVCSPSRAAIATGMYPSSIGACNMRTTSYTEVTGLPKYEALPPPEVKMMSELLRMQGYYCTNNNKKDYQFNAPVTAWDESSQYAHWRNRSDGQPFFSIFNFGQTHESGLFEPYGLKKGEKRHYRSGDRSFTGDQANGKTKGDETTVHLPMDTDFDIAPYHPDTEITRRDYWKVYNNIAEMDKQLGAILGQLETDGLMDNTIIFFYADHGGPLPRQKRLIYDSGLNSPMIIRFPDKRNAGTRDDQLISFIDFAPTVFSLVGMEQPSYLQGQAFLGKSKAPKERDYIHAAADRFDGFTDAIRAVRDKQFKYIRNYRPEQGYYLPVTYRERIPMMQELLRLREKGQLTPAQAQWFRESKAVDELFDCETDPHELNNLADDPAYANKLNELKVEMDRWLKAIDDQPNIPERELIDQLWQGADVKPKTAPTDIQTIDEKIKLSCDTEGASIGYQIVGHNDSAKENWEIYTKPINVPEDATLKVQSHRIGYVPSEIITFKPE